MGHRASRDEGFSIIEVVVAASILFFVITAVLGLVATSQRMTATAKRRSVLTNAMAEHVDSLRATPYSQITIESVPAAQDVMYQGFTVHFVHRVVYSDGEGGKYLKSIYVTGSTTIGGVSYSTRAVVHIKNPSVDAPAGGLIDPDKPWIEFDSATPPPDAVLADDFVNSTQLSIKLKTTAHSPGDQIVRVEYKVAGIAVRDSITITGREAIFVAPADFASAGDIVTETGWHTGQEGIADGFQTLSITAWDNVGRYGNESRRFIVDNVAPDVAGNPTAQPVTDVTAKLAFTTAPDPPGQSTTWATRYHYVLFKETSTGPYTGPASQDPPSGHWTQRVSTWVPSIPDAPTSVQMSKSGTMTVDGVPTEPFSRYWASIVAGSPRLEGPASRMAIPFVSRPAISPSASYPSTSTTDYRKTARLTFTAYTVSLFISKPSFPVDAAATTYSFMAKDSLVGSTWRTVTPTIRSITDEGLYNRITFALNESGDPKRLYFKVGIQVTPTGWLGGSPTPVMWTNAAGVTELDADPGIGVANSTMYPQGWDQ
jgi:hypothetical protein